LTQTHDSSNTEQPAALAGKIRLGDLTVNRMGYGAMRLPGPGVWGEPVDRDQAKAVLQRAVALGVKLIDTAGYYGAHVADRLIADALYPYPPDLVIVSKVGAARDAHGGWGPAARPEQIRAEIDDDLRALRLERLDLVHCRYAEMSGVPLSESLGALIDLRDQGKVRHIGVSNVSAGQLAEAQGITEIVSVQNRYSVTDRADEDIVDLCSEQGIAFMPFFPLGIGELAQGQGALAAVAERHGATPAQIALAWLLARSPVMLPIPGTSSLAHLEENVAAAAIRLTDEDLAELDGQRS
jgi:aryl-alcohol dehydrogenase-like predicted oxidoreductase